MRTDPDQKKQMNRNPKPVRYYMTTVVIVSLLTLLQLVILFATFYLLSRKIFWLSIFCRVISILAVISVVNRKVSPSYQLAWCVPILLFPICGGLAYVISRGRQSHLKLLRKMDAVKTEIDKQCPQIPLFPVDENNTDRRLTMYLASEGYRAYENSAVNYFDCGEAMYEAMIQAMSSAKKTIFMEFFIIRTGKMWDSIHEILLKKVSEGVEVRVIYDGMGSIKTLPRGYREKLISEGINAAIFRPFVPVVSTVQNNRDHRKIVLIDGEIGFTGGINISDEYVNWFDRCGKWKDSGIMLRGDAVLELTKMFLHTWDTECGLEKESALSDYLHRPSAPEKSSGIMIPYGDLPISEKNICKNVYLEIINHAKRYLYIMTPYFIPGEELLNALKLSAKSGVDVRLLTPRVGDKAIIHAVTRSYYQDVIRAGVRVYEYQPGFVHSKVFVADDRVSSVGTTNLDYRSLYLHFECGAVIYDRENAETVREDFLHTLTECIEINLKNLPVNSLIQSLVLRLIRVFEPLL